MRSAVWFGDRFVADLLDASRGTVILDAPSGVPLEHTHVPMTDLAELPSAYGEHPADIAFVSIGAGIGTQEPMSGEQLEGILEAVVAAVPDGTYLFAIIPSTLLAAKSAPGVIDPRTVELHGRMLAAVQVAARTGISVIDVDRLVAESGGGAKCVLGPLTYSDSLLDIARTEIIRILDDFRLLSADAVPVPQQVTSS